MTRTDTTVVGTLVVLLALIAGLVGIPALQASTAHPSATPGPSGSDVVARPYREGVLSRPVSVSPLTARTQADRDLVALVFSGLVRNGPDGTIVPDLARSWSVDETGRVWTFELQPDARWHDGEPVTSADVAYTIQTLQDPEYTGPASTSWSEVTVSTPNPGEVVFTLATPLGDFLQAATQPIAPVHLLGEIPIDLLPDAPFGRQPVGSGPFALTSLSDDEAILVPADPAVLGGDTPAVPSLEPSVAPTDSLVTAAPTLRPDRPVPYLPGIELHFYSDATTLAAAYRAGDLDAVSGVPPAVAAGLATGKDTRLLRYPGSTLTAVLLNQRPTHPEFRDPAVRTALLAAIDRGSLIDTAWTSLAVPAPGPIPPSSPLFDKAAEPLVPFSLDAARAALKKAGWTSKADGWYIPGAKKPLTIEVVTPEQSANPGAFAAAQAVARDWETLGLLVSLVPLPPSQLIKDRLITGDFAAAVTDVNIGFDPDLYALFASSQTRNGGSNLQGVQNLALDRLLTAARAPGTDEQRKAAYSALQVELGKGRYLLPLAYADEVAVVRHTLTGPVVRQVADPADRFWDVLTWRLAADR
jgi:peptide/nickel transport system substrate-binding protein